MPQAESALELRGSCTTPLLECHSFPQPARERHQLRIFAPNVLHLLLPTALPIASTLTPNALVRATTRTVVCVAYASLLAVLKMASALSAFESRGFGRFHTPSKMGSGKTWRGSKIFQLIVSYKCTIPIFQVWRVNLALDREQCSWEQFCRGWWACI